MEPTEAGRNMALLCDEILDSLGRFDATRIGRKKAEAAPLHQPSMA
jgi:hypothetical protein